jgi:tetratricopeptide (TPR) repeat protein
MQLGLAQAHWEMVRGLPAETEERRVAMDRLATALQVCSRDYEGALPLFEECVAVDRCVCGDEHPDTLAAIANLAALHHEMGHLEQALALGTEVVAVERRTLGSEHRSTLISISNLAGVHLRAGNYDRSLPLLDEALGAQRRTLGNQHVDTLSAIQNLAAVYIQVGWAA